MKKIALGVSLLFVIGLGAYFIFFNKMGESEQESQVISEKVDRIFDEDTSTGEKAKGSLSKEDIQSISESTSLTEDQIIELEATFEEIESKWQEEIEDIFINDMNLSKSAVQDYFKMREGFEKDSYEAFEAFHEEMVKKHGENYSYNPTEDEEAFQKKIRTRYEEELQKKIGMDNFKKYIQLKDSFNQRLIEKYDSNKGVLHIEF